MPLLTAGPSRCIYKSGTFMETVIGKPMKYLSKWILVISSTKGGQLLKQPNKKIPTTMITEWNLREDKPPLWPTTRRSALVSARKFIHNIQKMHWSEAKNACFMAPDTARTSVKYPWNIHTNTPPRGHTKNPIQASMPSTEKASSLIKSSKR